MNWLPPSPKNKTSWEVQHPLWEDKQTFNHLGLALPSPRLFVPSFAWQTPALKAAGRNEGGSCSKKPPGDLSRSLQDRVPPAGKGQGDSFGSQRLARSQPFFSGFLNSEKLCRLAPGEQLTSIPLCSKVLWDGTPCCRR